MVDIAPQARESYDKETQTELTGTGTASDMYGDDDRLTSPTGGPAGGEKHPRRSMSVNINTSTPGGSAKRSSTSPTARSSRSLSMDLGVEGGERGLTATTSSSSGGSLHGGGGGEAAGGDSMDASTRRALDDDEVANVVASADFKSFLDSSGRVMERILGSGEGANSLSAMLFRDFTSSAAALQQDSAVLSTRGDFDDGEGWLALRPVHDIQNNPHYPELVAVAYGASAARGARASKDSDGYVHGGGVGVWSYALPHRPEFRFTAPSPVLVVYFHPFDSHLVLGGCDNGLVLLWDMRAPKPEPVLASALSGDGHKYPIRSMCVVGSAVNYELVTASCDGMVCHWDLSGASLAEPTRVSTAQVKGQDVGSPSERRQIAMPCHISAVAFDKGTVASPFESRKLFIGTQAGGLLESSVPLAGEHSALEQVMGHEGTVTGVHVHPRHEKGFTDLLLTSSVDWTVKLWSTGQGLVDGQKDSKGLNPSANNQAGPLLEFRNQSYDYVVDVAWSTLNPTLFATITSGCDIVLWNITKSSVDAAATLRVSTDDKLAAARAHMAGNERLPPKTLNRLSWSSDGRRVLVGDNHGGVHIVAVADAEAVPAKGDSARFDLTLLTRRGMDDAADAGEGGDVGAAGAGAGAMAGAEDGDGDGAPPMQEVSTPVK